MRRALLAAPLLFLAAAFAWPLGRVLATQSLDGWRWALTSPYVRGRLAVAFGQALLSTAIALAAALPLAWLHHRHSLPQRWLHLHAAPFVMPVFVVVFGLQATLGGALAAMGPLLAVALANAYYNYGLAARLIHAALERRPAELEEAARTLGASPGAAFWRVSAPLLLPAVAAAALLAFLFSFASFGVVLYLGQGAIATLDTLLYETLGGAFPRPDRAAALALLQLAINALLLAAFLRLQRRSWQGTPPRPKPAGAWRLGSPLLALLALAPLAAILVAAFRLNGQWSLEPWRALLDPAHPSHLAGFSLAQALLNSVGYAVAACAIALALCLCLWRGARSRAWAEGLASLPLGTSSLVLGFGLAIAYGPGPLDLRGTYLVVLLAHVLIALPFMARALLPALDGLDARLAESAALLGASPLRTLLRVQLPLVRPALGVALGTAAALSLGDFGASLLLMSPDTMGLTVWIARHGGPASFDPLHRAEAIALAAVLMALTAAAYAALSWRPRRRAA
jgi:thiamine transport system permease protein